MGDVLIFPTSFQGVTKPMERKDNVCECPLEWYDEWTGEWIYDDSDPCPCCMKRREVDA